MDTENVKSKAGRKPTKKITTKVENKSVEKIETNKSTVAESKTVHKKKISIPLDTDISCKSAVRGTLTYVSKRMNGYQIVWNDFGDEEFLSFQELISMRNTDLRFFKDNWIVIEDSEDYTAKEIMDALKVSQYYNVKLDVDNFDSLFNESPEKIEEIVSTMSSGLKDTIAIRAKQLYNNGKLDSRKRIEAFEKSLGIELEVRS